MQCADVSAVAVAVLVALACIAIALASARRPARRVRGVGARAGRSTSILNAPMASSPCKQIVRIRVVHHGEENDFFWKDVHQGIADAESLLGNVKVHRVIGIARMADAILSTPALADGLIVTCPFRNTDDRYTQITDAIDSVIASGIPVISFNTDTLHNPEIYQYVGSQNKLLGKRGALTVLKKYAHLLPDEQPPREGINLSVSCEERAQELMRTCKLQSGKRRVSHVVGILQERLNVTLDWRVEEFHREWNMQTQPFAPTSLVKAYTLDEALNAVRMVEMQPGEETCVVVATGYMTLDEAIAVKQAHPAVYVCEVGDTGARVSALAAQHDVPFVGQMQYQQGFTAVTSMNNLIANYDGGRTWQREKGNAALTIEASYECTDGCELDEEKVVAMERDRGFDSPWIQIGFAVELEGLDISRWDVYDKANIGKRNTVVHHDGHTTESIVVDGAANYGATYASEYDERNPTRIYEGLLGERLQYHPCYERSIHGRNRCQYFIVAANGTRLPLGEMGKLQNGSFVRVQYSGATMRIVLYDEDDVINLQNVLKGSLGNRCAPCT